MIDGLPRRVRPTPGQGVRNQMKTQPGMAGGRSKSLRPAPAPVRNPQQALDPAGEVVVGDTSTVEDRAVAIAATIGTGNENPLGGDTSAANFGVAVGAHSRAAENAVALGPTTTSDGAGSVTLGFAASAYGVNAVALGPSATVGADGSPANGAVAIGTGASATGANEIALGSGSHVTIVAGKLVIADSSGGLHQIVVDTSGALSTVAYP